MSYAKSANLALSLRLQAWVCLVVLTGWLMVPLSSQAADATPTAASTASALPQDVFLYVSVKNVNELFEHCKQTTFWGLYRDAAMQEFIPASEKKITEFVQEQIKDVWKQSGLDSPPETLPLPQGQVTFAMRLEKASRTMPKYDFSGEGEPKVVGKQEITTTEPRVIAIADFGTDIAKVQAMVNQLAGKACEKDYRLTQETVRGVEVGILTPQVPKDSEAKDAEDTPPAQPEPTVFAFKGNVGMVSNDLKLMKEVLTRMGGEASGQESLADDAGFKKALSKLEADQADIVCYVNVQRAMQSAMDEKSEPKDRDEMKKVFAGLGIDGVSGVGAVVSIAGKPNEECRIKALALVEGPKRGLVELLAPEGGSTKPGALLTKDSAGFTVVYYEPGKLYDQILKMIKDISGQDPQARIDLLMSMLAGGQEGAEPMNLRKDFLEPMAGPVTFVQTFTKPYTDPNCQKTNISISLRDASAVDKAVARLHGAIIAQAPTEMKPKLKQEMLGTTIYVLPMPGIFSAARNSKSPDQADKDNNNLALAVVGENLAIGTLENVRQVIRDSKNDKDKADSIASDGMFEAASGFYPDRACMFSYVNQQVQMEVAWTQLKDAAKKEQLQPKKEGQDDSEAAAMASVAAMNPMAMVVDKLKKYCDFATLPDFAAVQQYFGMTAAYLAGTEDGIVMEMVYLKAPVKK
jgi:hypothetical protein